MKRESLNLQQLLERSGHLLRLGLPIAARDSLNESLELIGKDEALSWCRSQIELAEVAIEQRDYVAAADRLLFECLARLRFPDSHS